MKIATWNVNSVNARLQNVLDWFTEAQPDVACLQEIKCVDEKFPTLAFEGLGYNVAVHGQKSYNGVALLSKTPLEDVRRGLPMLDDGSDGEDEQSRYVEAVTGGATPVRVGCLYLPNGNPVTTDKFAYKLRWMERLRAHAAGLLRLEEPLALCGDFNIIAEPADCVNPADWRGDALFQPESRAAWRAIRNLGFTDAHAERGADPHHFTFWDYQAGAWQRNNGIRIDHVFLSPQAADRLQASTVWKDVRAKEKPSDHVPVMVTLALS